MPDRDAIDIKSALAEETHDPVHDSWMIFDEHDQCMRTHGYHSNSSSIISPTDPPEGIIG
jgi:hypothetical protein